MKFVNEIKNIIQYVSLIFSDEKSRKIITNSSWLVSDKIITIFLGIYTTSIISRYFGPQILGQMNYVVSITTLFLSFSTLGLETLMVKAVIDLNYNEGEILFSGFILRLVGGSFLVVTCMFLINVLEPSETVLQLLTLIFSINILMRSFEVFEYWVHAHQLAKNLSLIKIVVYLFTFSSKLLLVYFKGNIIHYALVILFDSVLYGLLLLVFYLKSRKIKLKIKFNSEFAKDILSKSWHLVVSSLLVTIYMKTDQIMLGRMMSSKYELGLYGAADYIASLWYFVPMAIIISFKPVILKKRSENLENYLKYLKILYLVITIIGILAGISIIFLSKYIVLIVFGQEYFGAINILSISVWSGTIAMLGVASSIWYISEGFQKYNSIFVLIGAFTNVGLNYVLIPALGGIGAAIATLITQVVVNLVAPMFFIDTRVNIKLIFQALRFRI